MSTTMAMEGTGVAVDSPDALAQMAVQLQERISHLSPELDPSWSDVLLSQWPVLQYVTDAALRDELMIKLLLRDYPALPSAGRLTCPEARLVLLPRGGILQSLAALAIACRPGVLRCCIDREVRMVMESALGPFFGPLVEVSSGGRPVSAQAAGWSPLHWSCMGYLDWLPLLRRDDRLFRRVVRLSLPAGLLAMHKRRRAAPLQLRPSAAMEMLCRMETGWPC